MSLHSLRRRARLVKSRLVISSAIAAALCAAASRGDTLSTYTGPANGNWSDAANWTNVPPGAFVPNNGNGGANYQVIIDANPLQNSTVTTNGSFTVNAVTIASGDALSISNNTALTIAGGTLNNSGLVNLVSAGNSTDLVLSANAAISGTGTITLTNTTANRIFGSSGSVVLTNSNTITGSGRIGLDQLQIVNNGAIIASSSSGLTIDPSDGGVSFTNNGTLSANGGNLFLNQGTYTGGVVDAKNGSAVQINGGAVVQSAIFQSDNSAAGTFFNSGLIANSTNNGLIVVSNNVSGTLQGTFVNHGTLALRSAGNSTDLLISGNVNLTGGGTVTMTNTTANRIYSTNGGTLTTDNLITGAGQLGNNQLAIVNSGTIIASSSTSLTLDPVDGANGFINNGTLRADGGNLILAGGSYANGSGVIQARNGSVVQINSAATVTGGILQSDTTSAAITLMGTLVNLTNAGTLQIVNNTGGSLSGTINNSSVINIVSAGNSTDLIMATDVNLTGGGTVTMTNTLANRIYGGTPATVLTSNNLITGSGQVGFNSAKIVNNGTIVASSSTGMLVDPTDGANGFINNGVLRADGGNMTFQSGAYNNAAGLIQARNGSIVQVNPGAVVTGGTLQTDASSAAISMNGGTLVNLTNGGAVQMSNNTLGNFVGTINNLGLINLVSAGNGTDFYIVGDVNLAGNGSLTMSNTLANRIRGDAGARLTNSNLIIGAGSVGINAIAITNNGTITASLSSGITIDPVDGANGFINNGILRADGGNLVLTSGSFTNNNLIQANNSSVVLLNPGATVFGGTLTTDSATGSAFSLNNCILDSLTNAGVIQIPNNQSATFLNTITNKAFIRFLSAGNATDLLISGNVTLNGGGTVTMSNTGANRIYSNNGGTLTTDNLITGAGQIGTNQLSVVNSGTMIASSAAGMILDPPDATTSGFTNLGLLRADGGTLQFNAGQFTNTGHIIEAKNGSTAVVGANAFIIGGTLQTDSNTNSSVTLVSGILVNLTNAGTVQINNNNQGFLQGTITNTGLIRLLSAGNSTDLILNGNLTLNGPGTVTLSNTQANRIYGSAGNTFINASTISGAGQLGFNQTIINNTGSIIGNLSGLTIDPQDVPDGFVSSGILRADGGSLVMQNGTYSLAGTIESIHGGNLTFAAGIYNVAVPIVLADNSSVNFSAGSISITTVTGAGALNVGNGGILTSNAVSPSGPWTLAGTHIIRSGLGNAGTMMRPDVPTVTSTGKLDLNDNKLIIQSTDAGDKNSKITKLNAELAAAFAGGTWTGHGITSAAAIADPGHYAVGLFDNAFLALTTFGGTPVDSNSILVAIAHNGDANRNGIVDIQDQSIVTNHWQTAQNNWAAGDLNRDGFVDLQDLTLVTNDWQQSSTFSQSAGASLLSSADAAPAVLSVPEPASLALLLIGGTSLLVRRRRRP